MPGERIDWREIPRLPKESTLADSEKAGFKGVKVDVYKLIHLTEGHPVEKVPLELYSKFLTSEGWKDQYNNRVAPKVICDLIIEHGSKEAARLHPEYARHIERIENADISFPIHEFEGHLLNGAHRIAKLHIKNQLGKTDQEFITVKKLRKIPEDALL